jgi:DNA repair protein RecO (recombination protein O)
MSREAHFTAIILKKQPFGEGDEIITFFTKEQGKIRCLAKAVKMPKSKLQQKLQALFLVELRVAGGLKFPKVVGAEPVKVFPRIRENLDAMKIAFYATELILKFTADEQKNQPLFNLLLEFLEFLNAAKQQTILPLGLAKFKIGVLEASGFGLQHQEALAPGEKVFYSPRKGGFFTKKYADSRILPVESYRDFLKIKSTPFENLAPADNLKDQESLQTALSQFIEYHLERKIKSEKYLNLENVI